VTKMRADECVREVRPPAKVRCQRVASYREYLPPVEIGRLGACVWEQEPTRPWAQRVIPDGCLDLVWLSERERVVAGADTAVRIARLPPSRGGVDAAGVDRQDGPAAGPPRPPLSFRVRGDLLARSTRT